MSLCKEIREAAMDVFEKSLQLLDDYFVNTDPSVVEEQLAKIDSLHVDGPAPDEYFAEFTLGYPCEAWFQTNETVFQTLNYKVEDLSFLSESFNLLNKPICKQQFNSNLAEEFGQQDNIYKAA